MDAEKLLVYGIVGYLAYKLLVPSTSYAYRPGGVAPVAPAPRPSTGEQITDAAIGIAQTYGVQQCIDAGYDPALCRQGGSLGGSIFDGVLDF